MVRQLVIDDLKIDLDEEVSMSEVVKLIKSMTTCYAYNISTLKYYDGFHREPYEGWDAIMEHAEHMERIGLQVEVDTDQLFADNDCGESEVMDYQYYTCTSIPKVEYMGDYEIGKWYDYELLKEKYHIPAGHKVIAFGENWGFGIAPNGYRLKQNR